jgi:hypothetical protein
MASWLNEVRAATTGTNIALSGIQPIDDVPLDVLDPVLVKDQTNASDNGTYVVQPGPWLRRDTSIAPEAAIRISEGTVNGHTEWYLATHAPVTLGTTPLTFAPVVGSWKNFARAASTANIALSAPGATIDDVLLNVGDRVLVKDQSTAAQNGIYVFNGSGNPMTRAADALSLSPEATVRVSEGSTNAHSTWCLTTQGQITVGTTSLTFSPLLPMFPSIITATGLAANLSPQTPIAIAEGYSTPGDGGGGVFVWQQTQPTGLTVNGANFNRIVDNGTVFVAGPATSPNGYACRVYSTEVSIAWFGALPNDPTKANANCAAINRAINAAQAGNLQIPAPGSKPDHATSTMVLFIPEGCFYVDGPLVIGSNDYCVPITIRGLSSRDSGLAAVENSTSWGSAGSALNAMFSFSNAASVSCKFLDLFINGNIAPVAALPPNPPVLPPNPPYLSYGITSNSVSHLTVSRVRIYGTQIAAINIGYGWCNTIENCLIDDNIGHGIVLNVAGSNNGVAINNNKIALNSGVGAVLLSGHNITVTENTFDTNNQAAICAVNVAGLVIENNYFEKNSRFEPGKSSGGLPFISHQSLAAAPKLQTPVYADIILGGELPTPLSTTSKGSSWSWPAGRSFPSGSVIISGNFLSTDQGDPDWIRYSNYAFVWLGAAFPVTISGNSQVIDRTSGFLPVPLCACQPYQYYGQQGHTTIIGNSGFGSDLYIVGFNTSNSTIAPGLITDSYSDFSDFRSDRVKPVNYMPQDVFKYAAVISTGLDPNSTIVRSSRKRGVSEVFDIYTSSESKLFGITIDIDAFRAELAGKLIYLAAEFYVTTPTTIPSTAKPPYYDSLVLQIGSIQNTTSGPSATGTWLHASMFYLMPQSGIVNVGFIATKGSCGTGIVSFTKPVLAVIGAPLSSFYREHQNVAWSFNLTTTGGTPPGGTWAVGDIVFNSQPPTQGTGYAGWICTTAGSPGSWRPFGALG